MELTHDIFVVLNYISVFVMVLCCYIISTHAESRMQKYALMVSLFLLCCCVGFLIRVEGNDVNTLIAGQKILYTFILHSMFYMLLFIFEYCKYKIPDAIVVIFNIVNWCISFIVLSLNHHSLFYKTYWAVNMGTYSVLEKEYGIFHTITVLIFALYMVAAVIVSAIFSAKNIKKRSSCVWRILVAVMIPCLSYIIPKVFDLKNDIQPIAFAAFTSMVIYMVYKDNLYDVDNIAEKYSAESMTDAIVVFDNNYLYKGCNKFALNILPELKYIDIDSDIRTVSSRIVLFLDEKIKEYVYNDAIFEISVKSIKSDGVNSNGRVLWLRDVTVQKNYSDLLNKQKKMLESQVVTLSDFSYKDDLTGLYNRRSYEEKLTELRNMDSCDNLIFAAFDINGLKHTNDSIGHLAGDELIQGTASILAEVMSKHGKVFRTGGDEFFAILDNWNKPVSVLVEQINEKMKSWRGNEVHDLSFSYGIVYGDDCKSKSVNEIIKLADDRMYMAKKEYHHDNI